MRRLFRQFSAPGGIPSHVSVTTPGSIHEGGELGYVLVHAFGAVMDNPDLVALAVVGDGEAETGPLEGSWKGISFLNPARDGAVLPSCTSTAPRSPAPPSWVARTRPRCARCSRGTATTSSRSRAPTCPACTTASRPRWPRPGRGSAPSRTSARGGDWDGTRPRWPMIVLRSPKGWTGPDKVDGVQMLGTFRSHQVPLAAVRENPAHLRLLEEWLRSYRPEELFDADGAPTELVRRANPDGRRCG